MSRRIEPSSLRWLLVAAVAGSILITSVVPVRGDGLVTTGPFGLVGLDKWAHTIAYAVLAGAVAFALVDRGMWSARSVGLVLASTLAYGLAIEVLQTTVPSRAFDPLDVVADGVGVLLVVLAWGLLAWHRRRSTRPST